MALPSVTDAQYPTPEDVLNTILRALRYGYARRGIDINILEGSDHWYRAKAYADRVSVAVANNQIALADSNPLTATGDALETLAGIFGVTKRPAAKAAGPVKIACVGTVSIPAGFQCTAPDGQQYQTITAGTYATLSTVQVIALVGGTAGNQDFGTHITWDSASIGALRRVATVGVGGLEDGAEADDDEVLRDRLLRRLSFPSVGGNWAFVIATAEDASAAVSAAYCYMAAQGPASYDVAVLKNSGDRTLTAPTLATVAAALDAVMPGQQRRNVTTVTPEEVDIVFQATLPLPLSAGGAGGGWLDSSPWPAENTKVTSGGATSITVNSAASPTVGNHIGIWDTVTDADEPVMREYVVAVVGGSTNSWTVQVQGAYGFTVPAGAYISAGAVNLTGYAAAILETMRTLGPGEKTESPEILPLARRHPSPDIQDESDLTTRLGAAVTAQFSELRSLDYTLRVATGTASPTVTSPSVPLTTADPPKVLVLAHLAIRA